MRSISCGALPVIMRVCAQQQRCEALALACHGKLGTRHQPYVPTGAHNMIRIREILDAHSIVWLTSAASAAPTSSTTPPAVRSVNQMDQYAWPYAFRTQSITGG